MTSLERRSLEPEIMDDLNCNGPVVHQTLRELDVINRLLGGNDVTIDGLDRLLSDHGTVRKLIVADIGCGSGDMAKRITRWGRKKGLDLNVICIDANPHIIRYASDNCEITERVSFEVLDVLGSEYSQRRFDIVVATLFTHHFSGQQLVELFRTLKEQVKIGFVINDIHRNAIAYYAIRILTKLFSKSAMVRYDAPLSVRRAFKRKELEDILIQAGIDNYTIKWKWAFRWQIVARQ